LEAKPLFVFMQRIDPAIVNLVKAALDEDIGPGDITSLACLEPHVVRAEITAKSDGILSGTVPALLAFAIVDSANEVKFVPGDGDAFKKGDVITRIDGLNQTILTAERTALNFLARLSGVATLSSQFVAKVQSTSCRILDTRKTTPGWRLLEKQAVVHGGGENHRTGLYDMMLIKDNHIVAAGSIANAVKQAQEYLQSEDCRRQFGGASGIEIEVEVTTEAELREAIKAGVKRLLLDNQSPDSLAKLVVVAREVAPDVKLEASGGVTLDNVATLAGTGVDYISIGALTHSAPACDFSLNLLN
jgi:nicotinate-nucleotide pyrophosphorylase (carboxylating)